MNHELYGEPWLPSRINNGTSCTLGIVLWHPAIKSQSDVWKVAFRGTAEFLAIGYV